MIILRTLSETVDKLTEIKKTGHQIGLVPTMGALHKGHVSLLDCCKSENDISVVSIFVNPTQFNDPEDLEKYPRNQEKDLQVLSEAGCDIAFVPDEKTIYPVPDNRIFDFGNLDKIMEGSSRPGHFNGVAQVVSRLFDIIKPDRAYFGEKDIQQIAIIRKMTALLKLPVIIRACPTLRENDGLAMSSRNVLLNPRQRKSAVVISQTLKMALYKKELSVGRLKQWVIDTINLNDDLEVEYFEIVDSCNLQPVQNRDKPEIVVIGCIAVRAGNVRLIDNVFFHNFVST